jgi:hypothetical protein
MKALAFQQVDVFTAVPFKGNPVALCRVSRCSQSRLGPTSRRPRSSARRPTSEPTIVCASSLPGESCRLRAILQSGSAHAMLRRGHRLVQECGKDLVDIKIDGLASWMRR